MGLLIIMEKKIHRSTNFTSKEIAILIGLVKQLEEKHQKEMSLQEEESKEKIRMAIEEHNAKMEIIKLEKQILIKKLQS